MKRRELEKVVEKHLKQIEKRSGKVPGSFVEEDIHELRVEYKKLRAFVRLVVLDKDAGDLKLTGKLRSLYHAAGNVRDLDLFIKQVKDSSQKDNQDVPHYIKHLHSDLFAAKEVLVKEIEKAGFVKINKSLLEELPGSLGEDTVRKFVHRKVAAIRLILLAVETEKELHTIRKQLKDITYNIKIFQSDWGLPFPVTAWKSEKQLNDMAVKLGDFNDLVLRILLLKSVPGNLPAEELEYITNRRKDLQQQAAENKKSLLEQVQQLPLNSNF
jgi:CHAD domain-containing protein